MGTDIKHPVPYQVKPSFVTFDITIKHPEPDRVKPLFVIFDIRAL